ncbi:hypothetical protein FMUND_933 [Fusarium mundagurra]|uniref:Uncharacterized protein n=1 Tax=Fusarium mundagurra TaxID=1567541 RepID=A0A8H6DPI8_9HYPO|nr:hypothetical protein FMUND_933 [Fusarium mundagurra]
MGKASKELKQFINEIPDSCLNALPDNAGTIRKTTDFRLDMQGMTTDGKHNIQVQVTISTLKKVAPKTVAGPALVPSDGSWTPADIRADLLAKILI